MNCKKRLIIVLGMHRSGTSALTKGLEAMGVNLGADFIPPHADNPKGYWEDSEFFKLNEDLMTALNRSWDDCDSIDPEAFQQLIQGAFFSRALELVQRKCQQNSTVGIKDPRFSLLLPFWRKVFEVSGVSIFSIVAIRNPLSVARSLAHRDSLPKAKSLWLWAMYNLQIISDVSDLPRVVVDYDELMDDPIGELMRVAHYLGLSVDRELLASYSTDFLDPKLRHARYSNEQIEADSECDPVIFEIYQMLRSEALEVSVPDPAHCRQMASRWQTSLWNLRTLRDLATDFSAEIRVLKRRLTEEGERISNLESSLYLCRAKVSFLEFCIQNLKSSRSWKITAPLRYLFNFKDFFSND